MNLVGDFMLHNPSFLCIPFLFHFMYKKVYISYLKGVYLALRCRKILGLRDGSLRFQVFWQKSVFIPGHMTSRYDVMTSRDVIVRRHDVTA